MVIVVIGMLVALLIAGVVVAAVALPAYREGRQVLTPEGEQLVQTARERTVEAVGVARERTVEAVGVAKDKVGDLAEKLPVSRSADDESAPELPRAQAAAADLDIDLRGERTDARQHRS